MSFNTNSLVNNKHVCIILAHVLFLSITLVLCVCAITDGYINLFFNICFFVIKWSVFSFHVITISIEKDH